MDKVSFVEFFLLWAKRQQWEVPDIHVIACHWLEHKGNLAVLRCFRGFGKSTILAVYNAWKLYKDPTFRILHQSETDGTAYKTSRDTKNVLRKHPLTNDLLQQGKASGSVIGWWVNGATDIRNASMYSRGILSNVTSARADECQNDDVEVPRNTATEEAREKMRERLDEQTHILVPNGSKLYIGTPHTYDSLYDRIEKMGADCLTIKMFEEEHRITLADKTNYEIPFEPEYVMSNIGGAAKVLIKDIDYKQHKNIIFFNEPPNGLIDCYAGPAWPERFTIEELEKRRRETETINKWDSQYQLHAKPITETRLDPNRLIKYTHDMTVKEVNKTIVCFVGGTRIVGASAYWDCSLGKDKSDGSVLTLVLTDATGCLYIHYAGELKGDLAVFDDDENKGNIIGGQVYGVREAVLRFNIPSVIIETNGVGGFVPPILRKALKGTGCAVIEKTAKGNKQERILSALEAPLSSGFLYAHADVFNTKLIEQMRTFNPLATNQKDDFLDSLTGAVLQTPIRIGKIYNRDINQEASVKPWRANTTIHRVSIDF